MLSAQTLVVMLPNDDAASSAVPRCPTETIVARSKEYSRRCVIKMGIVYQIRIVNSCKEMWTATASAALALQHGSMTYDRSRTSVGGRRADLPHFARSSNSGRLEDSLQRLGRQCRR